MNSLTNQEVPRHLQNSMVDPFFDAFHLASSDAAEAFYTFDERFIRKGKDAVPPVLKVPEH